MQFTHPLCTDCRTVETRLRNEGHELVIVLPLVAALASWGLRHFPRVGAALCALTLAATLTCYLACFACLFAFGYSLAALAAPGLADNVRAAVERQARP